MRKRKLSKAKEVLHYLKQGCNILNTRPPRFGWSPVIEDRVFNSLSKENKSKLFDKVMLLVEPELEPCPSCKEYPTYHEAYSAGPFSGNSEYIECEKCELIFKGRYHVIYGSIIEQWNNAFNSKLFGVR